MKKFWNFIRDESGERILRLEGPIDEDNFWGDTVTPDDFRDDLEAEEGNVTVWINSPGGNVFAAAQIYTMLCDHKGKITVKIDAIAASAASVIAMAGDRVLMSPVAMLMIHDPMTIAMGNAKDMEKAISTLNEVKASIINAYQKKTGLSRNKISQLMEDETWMNAKKAVDMGFADGILFTDKDGESANEGRENEDEKEIEAAWKPYSTRAMGRAILDRIVLSAEDDARTGEEPEKAPADETDVEPSEEGLTGTDAAGDDLHEEAPDAADFSDNGDAGREGITDKDKPGGNGTDGEEPDSDDDPDEDGTDRDETEDDPDEPDEDDPEETGAEAPDDPDDNPDEPDEGTDKPKQKAKDRPGNEAKKPPAIGMDGKTEDGAMPYELVRKQLDFLRRG